MFSQTLVGPLIKLGVLGLLRVTVKLRRPLDPQSFVACTVIAPVAYALLKLTVMLVVPWPLAIVAFAGTAQIYEVAPTTAGTLYVAVPVPMNGQALIAPVI